MASPSLLRDRTAGTRVTNTELFFDLVYVVAVTQLSGFLREHPTWSGALGALILLGMIWNAWVYTTWVTNWLDPDRNATRLMLLAVMGGSLVLAAGVHDAYDDKGLWVGIAYAAIQIGRSVFTVWAARSDDALRRNYQRILCWCLLSGAVAVVGGALDGPARLALFALAVVIDIVGGIVQFWTPGLGRTPAAEWDIDGPHFAERCQAFVLIALGESVVGISSPLAEADHVDAAGVAGTIGAFITVSALFLLYFDRWAHAGVSAVRRAAEPGKLAARGYHLVHPIIVGGIILVAAGNEEILASVLGGAGGHHPDSWLIAWFCAGGAATFVLGHAIYIRLISGRASTTHLIAFGALLVVVALGGGLGVSALGIGIATGLVVVLLVLVESARTRTAR